MNVQVEHVAITRHARIYTLGDRTDARDVWIVCHGYGQLAGRFIRHFAPIAAAGRLIVAPEGLHRFYLDPPPAPAAQRRVGATWMTREDREADMADYVAYLDAVARHAGSANPAHTRALGFSQGCATIVRWALRGETRIDELILWGGEVPPDAAPAPLAARLAGGRARFVQGTRDQLSHAARAREQKAALEAAGLRCEWHEHPGGHHLDRDTLAALASRD